jgi:hypothetical protein
MIVESYLHYVWPFQFFTKTSLTSCDGKPINIIDPGILNRDAGPDFLNAKIEIDQLFWHGPVEIHCHSSDWLKHNHSADPNYQKVILHVVWNKDTDIIIKGENVPTLELKERIHPSLLNRFYTFFKSKISIPCQPYFERIDALHKHNMLDKAFASRLSNKSLQIFELLNANRNSWDETTYQLLGKSFGFKLNSEVFLQLCSCTPYRVVKKISHNPKALEALFFGQAGFLAFPGKGKYQQELRKEYEYLQSKFSISSQIEEHHWKFLRLRPNNFPTVRIAQLCALLHKEHRLFAFLLQKGNLKELKEFLRVSAGSFWDSHFHFNKSSPSKPKTLGERSVNTLIINTVAPLLFAYGEYIDDPSFKERAQELLQNIPKEHNRITRVMVSAGFSNQNAYESQGLLELYHGFCKQKKCLYCNIGTSILKPT